jgi:D-amino-acid dehydrogenase
MSRHSDVVIIGGGIIGLTCAYYLKKAGRQVCVIEQDKIGSGASHGNCGLIYTSNPSPLCAPGTVKHEIKRFFKRTSPLYVKPGFDLGRFRWLLSFAGKCNAAHFDHALRARQEILHHSQTLYDALFEKEQLDGDLEKKGILLVYKSKTEWQDYAKTNVHLEPYGLGAKPIVGDALFELEPALGTDLYGAWYHPADSHMRPDRFLTELKDLLVHRGVFMEEDCRLDRFELDRGRISGLITTIGKFSADSYVLAAGAWSPQITRQLGLKIPVQPGKGYSLTMDTPAVEPPNCPKIPCYLHERGVVATTWKSGFRLGGTMEFSGFNTTVRRERIQNLKTAAREYLKAPPAEAVGEEWIGLRPMTFDDLPIIGRAPRHRNLILATGHGMMGITMAPGTGRLVAEIITESDPHIDPAPYSIKRF